jgi:hypothetical protein
MQLEVGRRHRVEDAGHAPDDEGHHEAIDHSTGTEN